MPQWKKILVSGSDIDVSAITVKSLTTGTPPNAAAADKVVRVNATTGKFETVLASSIAGTVSSGVTSLTTGSEGLSVTQLTGSIVIDVAADKIDINTFSGSLLTSGITGLGDIVSANSGTVTVGTASKADTVDINLATSTTNAEFRVTMVDADGVTYEQLNATPDITFNPSSKILTVPQVTGNASTATLATTATTANAVAANSVELSVGTTGSYVETITTSTTSGIDIGTATGEKSSPALTLNLAKLTTISTSPQTDFLAIVDQGDSDKSKKILVEDFVKNISGSGTLSSNGKINVAYGTAANTALVGTTVVDNVSTANLKTQLANVNGSITIGSSATADTIILNGNLQVQGSSSVVHYNDIHIADSFITLNSGSSGVAVARDSGIIVQQGNAGSGEALYFEPLPAPTSNGSKDIKRWAIGVEENISGSLQSVTPEYYVGLISTQTEINVPGTGNTQADETPIGTIVAKEGGEMFILARD